MLSILSAESEAQLEISQHLASRTFNVNGLGPYIQSRHSKVYSVIEHTDTKLRRIRATGSFLSDASLLGLKADKQYGRELNNMRNEGLCLVELEGMAVDRRKTLRSIASLCRKLMCEFFNSIKHHDRDSYRIITVVASNREDFFVDSLGFKKVNNKEATTLMSISWVGLLTTN